MLNQAHYEERILNEIRLLPEAALPRVIRWLSFFREEFIFSKADSIGTEKTEINLLKTRPLEIQQTVLTTSRRRINIEEILQIGRDCAALPDIDTRTPDEILGYDKSQIGLWDNRVVMHKVVV
ncbi:MAG: hypothetical protein BWK78_00275 [Thiotrichaceae bacterium IS1]|nr:MAG: hypothetical protein BWK78_00275 [Thiotrichaceae bacterium IS1]